MKINFKKIFALSSIVLATSSIAPFITSCKENDKYINGPIYDNSLDNFDDSNKPLLPEEIVNVINKDTQLSYFATSENIAFKDYEKPSINENGEYVYIHNRGELIEKKLNAQIIQNKDEFLNKFNFDKYNQDNGNTIEVNNGSLTDDIYYWILNNYNLNGKFFRIVIDHEETSLNFVKSKSEANNSNKVEFKFTFHITNTTETSRTINIENIQYDLLPDTPTKIVLKTNGLSNIENIININSNKYYLGWMVKNINLSIGSKITQLNEFNPTPNSFSHAYPVEFGNLTNKKYFDPSNGDKFMDDLSVDFLEQQLKAELTKDLDFAFVIMPDIKMIFDTLASNPTLGVLISNIAKPLNELLTKYGVMPEPLVGFVYEIMLSFNENTKILSILDNHKIKIVNFLKDIIKKYIGDFGDLLDIVLEPIGPNMTQDEKDQILNLVGLIQGDIGVLIKNVLNKLFENPNIVDFIVYILNEAKSQIEQMLTPTGLTKENVTFILNIINKILEHSISDDGKSLIYVNNIFDVFFKDEQTKKDLYNGIKSILKVFNIDIAAIQNGILDDLIIQAFEKNGNFSVANIQAIFTELSKIATFLSDGTNYEVIKEFEKIDDKNVTYNNETKEFNFKYKFKFIFKKELSVDVIEKIFNLLPNIVYVSSQKLGISIAGITLNDIEVHKQAITKIFPNKFIFAINDSFNMEYTPTHNLIQYDEFEENENIFAGVISMIDVKTYFTQASNDKGIISSTINEFVKASDFKGDYKWGKVSLHWDILLNMDIKNCIENVKRLLGSTIETNMWFSAFDKTKSIESNTSKEVYQENKTFQWLDTDYNQQSFVFVDNVDPIFHSKQWSDTFSYIEFLEEKNSISYNYSYVSSSKGNKQTGSLVNSYYHISDENKKIIESKIFNIDKGFDKKDINVSVKPITTLDFERHIYAGTKLFANIHGAIIKMHIKLLTFQVSVLLPSYALDITNYSTDSLNNNYIKNPKFSNKFSKTIVAPRISVKIERKI